MCNNDIRDSIDGCLATNSIEKLLKKTGEVEVSKKIDPLSTSESKKH